MGYVFSLICRGGTIITAAGTNLDSVANPRMIITQVYTVETLADTTKEIEEYITVSVFSFNVGFISFLACIQSHRTAPFIVP